MRTPSGRDVWVTGGHMQYLRALWAREAKKHNAMEHGLRPGLRGVEKVGRGKDDSEPSPLQVFGHYLDYKLNNVANASTETFDKLIAEGKFPKAEWLG